jgi:hypothetical protein
MHDAPPPPSRLGKLAAALPALGDPARVVAGGPAAVFAAKPVANKGFIVGPRYDSLFFIFSPLLALALGLLVANSPLENDIALFGAERTFAGVFIGTFIFAHLVAVVFRSHLNPKIFRRHPLRFTLVPIALLVGCGLSPWVLVVTSVIATFWDVYHSSMQTFGLGRIYDMRAGNEPRTGRYLDMIFNLFLYAGPIAAGASLMDHVEDFYEFEAVGSAFFSTIPAYVDYHSRWLTWGVLCAGVPFYLYYAFAYWRFHRRGYRISWQKVALYVSTGVTSIFVWGFNPFGEAFFIMNFFHAFQYFAIVWWSEKGTMVNALRLGPRPWSKPLALTLFLGFAFAYGFGAEIYDGNNPWPLAVILMIAIMHFWYDGFVWSVRRKEV